MLKEGYSKPGGNKPLVALVEKDYVNESMGIFDSRGHSHSRHSDEYALQTPSSLFKHDSSRDISRLSSTFQESQSLKSSHNTSASNYMGLGLTLSKQPQPQYLDGSPKNSSVERKLSNQRFERATKADSVRNPYLSDILSEKPATLRDSNLQKRLFQASSGSGMRHSRQASVSEAASDSEHSESTSKTSVDKEVDISTYVREQRKIIKKVSSGSKMPSLVNDKNEKIHYEIKEFKRERRGSPNMFPDHRNSREELKGVFEEEKKSKLRVLDDIKKRIERSDFYNKKINLNKLLGFMSENYQIKERRNSSGDTKAEIKQKPLATVGRVNMSRRTYQTNEEVIKSGKLGTLKESALLKEFKSAGVQKNEKDSPVNVNNSNLKSSKGFRFELSKQLPGHKRVESMQTDRDHFDQEFARKATEQGAKKKLQKGQLIVVGDDLSKDKLASKFKERMERRGKAKPEAARESEGSPVPERLRSADLSKQDLRKKMMEYGRKRQNLSNLAMDTFEDPKPKNGLNPKDHKLFQKNLCGERERAPSPSDEVLERLARGIKPKVAKSEMYEITKRQMEKFKKLNQQRNNEGTGEKKKKEEALERKKRVKALDLVKNLLFRGFATN
jgi:hypothetical protein